MTDTEALKLKPWETVYLRGNPLKWCVTAVVRTRFGVQVFLRLPRNCGSAMGSPEQVQFEPTPEYLARRAEGKRLVAEYYASLKETGS